MTADYPCYGCERVVCDGCSSFDDWVRGKGYPLSTKPIDIEYYPESAQSHLIGDPYDDAFEQAEALAAKLEEGDDKPLTAVDGLYAGYSRTYNYGYAGYTKWKCDHKDWLTFTDTQGKEVRLFLRSSGQQIDAEVDVFVDLTSNDPWTPHIPDAWRKYLPDDYLDAEYVVSWKISDGHCGDELLVEFILNLIEDGKVVGFGCMGGHGRTGWLAAKILVALAGMCGDDAVKYVRKNYCHKAVESKAQMQDLGCVEEAGSYESRGVQIYTYPGGKV